MSDFEWKITKTNARCATCSAQFNVGQEFFSALLQQATGLERRDFCAACFQSNRPAEVYYFWKTTLPAPDAAARKRRQPVMDVEFVTDFFRRLEGGTDPQKRAFRYILALMLARKKVLVFDGVRTGTEGEEQHLYRERQGGQVHAVAAPLLSEQEIAAVSAELGVLLGLTAPPAPAPAASAGSDAGDAAGTTEATGTTETAETAAAPSATEGTAEAAPVAAGSEAEPVRGSEA